MSRAFAKESEASGCMTLLQLSTGKTQKEAWQNAADKLDAPVLSKALSDSLKHGVKKSVRVGKPRTG